MFDAQIADNCIYPLVIIILPSDSCFPLLIIISIFKLRKVHTYKYMYVFFQYNFYTIRRLVFASKYNLNVFHELLKPLE